MHQLGLQGGGVGNIAHHHHDAGHGPLLVPHGAQIDRELAHAAIATQNLQVEIVHLLAAEDRVEGLFEGLAADRGNERLEPRPEHLQLLISHVLPAAVGVAHPSLGIGDQDQTLRVIQDLAGEVPLPLQLRLVGLCLLYTSRCV